MVSGTASPVATAPGFVAMISGSKYPSATALSGVKLLQRVGKMCPLNSLAILAKTVALKSETEMLCLKEISLRKGEAAKVS